MNVKLALWLLVKWKELNSRSTSFVISILICSLIAGGDRYGPWDRDERDLGRRAGERWSSDLSSAAAGRSRSRSGGPPQLAGDFDAGEEFEPPKKRPIPDLRYVNTQAPIAIISQPYQFLLLLLSAPCHLHENLSKSLQNLSKSGVTHLCFSSAFNYIHL